MLSAFSWLLARRVGCSLARCAVTKRGSLSLNLGCFRVHIRIILHLCLRRSSGLFSGLFSWCLRFPVIDFCRFRRIDFHKGSVHGAWSFPGVVDSVLLSVPYDCRFDTLTFCCRVAVFPIGLLVCALSVYLCRFLCREPSAFCMSLFIEKEAVPIESSSLSFDIGMLELHWSCSIRLVQWILVERLWCDWLGEMIILLSRVAVMKTFWSPRKTRQFYCDSWSLFGCWWVAS